MDKYYLQFYGESSLLFDGVNRYTELMNGFSYQRFTDGDYIWAKRDLSKGLDIDKGVIYASVWYKDTAIRLFEIAKENPNLDVFVGGPICFHYDLTLRSHNYHVIRDDAADYFNNYTDWNLPVPPVDGDIGYSVSLIRGQGCYWGKCLFCKNTGTFMNRDIERIPIVEHPGKKYIWLHTFAMSPRALHKYYPQFEDRDDIKYCTYIRADKAITESYRKLLPKLKVNPKHLAFDIGIEFPSNRMLDYMKKGTSIEEYIEFIKLAASVKSRIHFNLIIGWKNTTWDDVKNVEFFLNEVSKITEPNTITGNLYPLLIVKGRPLWSEYKNDKLELYTDTLPWKLKNPKLQREHIWDIHMGTPILTKEQNEIKYKLRELYHSFQWLKLHDWVNDKLY